METTKLTVRLDAALMKRLKIHVAARGTTVQDFVVGAVASKLPKEAK
jgi:predicted DNA binding CopG/RHH family protein